MPPAASILSVSYELRPPSSTSAPPNISATTTHDVLLQVPDSQSESEPNFNAYYTALRDAIMEAKNITGRELTAWRDAVGDEEKEKTGGKEKVDKGEEAEEEEDQEEDQEEEVEVKER